jgi:hypothetical protein
MGIRQKPISGPDSYRVNKRSPEDEPVIEVSEVQRETPAAPDGKVEQFERTEPTHPPVIEVSEIPRRLEPPQVGILEQFERTEITNPPVVRVSSIPRSNVPPPDGSTVEQFERTEPTHPPVMEVSEIARTMSIPDGEVEQFERVEPIPQPHVFIVASIPRTPVAEPIGQGITGPIGPTGPAGGGAIALDDLSDVQITSPGSFAQLVFNPDTDMWEAYVQPAGTINRTGGLISSIELGNGVTWTITRDGNDRIYQITNSEKTWTFTRDGDGKIASWTVT